MPGAADIADSEARGFNCNMGTIRVTPGAESKRGLPYLIANNHRHVFKMKIKSNKI